MPFTLTAPASRRQFLHDTLGTLTVFSSSPLSAVTGSSLWILAADTHIAADPAISVRGVNMTAQLRTAVAQILAEAPDAESIFINGDCAYLEGLPPDYVQLISLLAPLRQAGLDVHLTLGNHDNRRSFRKVLAQALPEPGPVPGKHLTLIRTPLANWFLLDSLQMVNVVTGELGEAQLGWLEDVLDQFPNQPAILLAHHNPQFEPAPLRDGRIHYTGLADSTALFDLLHRKPQVQAYVYGHSHNWGVSQTSGGLHLINLPPIGYVFDSSRPSGWVKTTLHRHGLHLELRSLNPNHPEHAQELSLPWR